MANSENFTQNLSENPSNLNENQPIQPLKSYPCPQCKKLTAWQGNEFKPFCSERCRLIDFGAWANEDYKIPTQEINFSQQFEH